MESRTVKERAVPIIAVAIAIAFLVGGAVRSDLLDQLDSRRALELLGIAAGVLSAAALVSRVLMVRPALAAAAVVAVLYVAVLGVAPVASAALLAAAALAIGSGFLPRAQAPASPWLALVLGLAIIAGVLGWLLPFRLHFGPLYVIAALVGVAVRRKVVAELLRAMSDGWRAETGDRWLGAVCIAIAAAMGTTTWLPTASFDDLAYHLGLPWQLADYGRYRLDPESQVWALSAWAGDVLHATVQLMAGREGRGALNALYLVVFLHLLHALARGAGLSGRGAWLVVMLAVSQPVTAALGFSMQTELAAGVTAVAAALVVQQAVRVEAARYIIAFSLLAAFGIGLKISNVIFLGPLGVWLLLRLRSLPLGPTAHAAALAVLVGGSSFVYAAVIAGNPVLPLFNDIFGSPFFAEHRFRDARYSGLLAWSVPFDLVLDSSRFFESWDGTAGFQWLAWLGPLLLALGVRPLRPLVLIALVSLIAMFLQAQYLRYLYPGLALAAVPLVGGLRREADSFWAVLVALALAVANLGYAANAAWQFRDPGIVTGYGSAEREHVWLSHVAPERLVARYLRTRYGDGYRLLLPQPDRPYAAEHAGRAFTLSWYDAALQRAGLQAAEDASGERLRQLALDLGASHVLIQRGSASPAVLHMVEAYGSPEMSVGGAELYRVPRRPEFPVEPVQQDSDSAVYLFALPTRGPVVVDTEVIAACSPAGGGVHMRWSFQRRGQAEREQVVYGLCDAAGQLRASQHLRFRGEADRLELRVQPGEHPYRARFELKSVAVIPRRDLTAERDLSARLYR